MQEPQRQKRVLFAALEMAPGHLGATERSAHHGNAFRGLRKVLGVSDSPDLQKSVEAEETLSSPRRRHECFTNLANLSGTLKPKRTDRTKRGQSRGDSLAVVSGVFSGRDIAGQIPKAQKSGFRGPKEAPGISGPLHSFAAPVRRAGFQKRRANSTRNRNCSRSRIAR